MPWVRIHDGALRNLKISALSDGAFRLWVAGLAHAQEHLTDGEIRREHLKMLTAKTTTKTVAELTTPVASNRAPLWEVTELGYQIHDYGQWNDTRDVVIRKRDEKRTRIARWRAARDGPQDAPVDALQDALKEGATTSTPTTTSTPLKNLGGGARGADSTPSLVGRRNLDLLTYGPIKLWASQFRDEILPLVATHFGGSRDEADGPARAWIGEVDTFNQSTVPSAAALKSPAKWWNEQAITRWVDAPSHESGTCTGCGSPDGQCVDVKLCNARWLEHTKAAQARAKVSA